MAGAKVLIVSNDDDFTSELSDELEKLGNDVFVVEDWIYGNKIAHEEKPDLIVLGMSFAGREGLDVLSDLQNSVETMLIPVIVVSRRDNPVEEKEALNLGAVAYFKTPFSTAEVLRTAMNFTGD